MTGNEDIHKDFSADQCMGNLVKFISKFWNFHWRLVCQLSIIAAQISKTSGVLNVCFYRYLLSILTTYVKKDNPALEKVLTIIKDLKGVYIAGSRDGTVVRALTSHQCGPVSIPARCHMWVGGVCCWFLPCSEGFTTRSPVFLPLQKPTL